MKTWSKRFVRVLALALVVTLPACKGLPKVRLHGQVAKLVVIDRTVGSGPVARAGMEVQVRYTGWLYDDRAADKHGTEFDSSSEHGGSFHFVLGQGQVIPGWDQGVAGMRVGGKRTLLIPAALAYGSRGAGGVIPPGASLVFNIQLLSVKPD